MCFIVLPGAFGKRLPEAIFKSSSRAQHFFSVGFRGIAGVIRVGACRWLPKDSVCVHGFTVAGFCESWGHDSGSLVATLGTRSCARGAAAEPTSTARDRILQLHSAAIGSGKTMNQCSNTPSAISDARSV